MTKWIANLQLKPFLQISYLVNMLKMHLSHRKLPVILERIKDDSMTQDFPDGSDSKESACNAGDLDLIPRLGRSPGERNGFPLQCFCLENSMDRGAWRASVHGFSESRT